METIDPGKYPDWKATVAFYVAVHRVEELRDLLDGTDLDDHIDRRDYVQARHRAIQPAFQQLYNVSRLARYQSSDSFARQFNPAAVRGRVIGGWLKAVDDYVDAEIERINNPPTDGDGPATGA